MTWDAEVCKGVRRARRGTPSREAHTHTLLLVRGMCREPVTAAAGSMPWLCYLSQAAQHELMTAMQAELRVLGCCACGSNVLPVDMDVQRDFFSESSPSALRAVFASWSLAECKRWCASRLLLLNSLQPCSVQTVLTHLRVVRSGSRLYHGPFCGGFL